MTRYEKGHGEYDHRALHETTLPSVVALYGSLTRRASVSIGSSR
jgi:hypothetical protein